MGIKEDDLVKLLDMYMSGNGHYIKPTVDESGKCNVFIGKDNARPSTAPTVFEQKKDVIGSKQEVQIFTGKADGECITCADVPNLMEIIPEEI